MVDYRVFGAGVHIQAVANVPRELLPNAWVEVPDIKFEVFIEITHPMCAGHT